MKLLFDQNLSPRLVTALADFFPDSNHVAPLGLGSANDRAVWNYAAQNNFTIVTKDADFNEISLLLGFPPKIVWLRRGNCTTNDIETLIRTNAAAIQNLENDATVGILTLY